jgi:hypothetical protein
MEAIEFITVLLITGSCRCPVRTTVGYFGLKFCSRHAAHGKPVDLLQYLNDRDVSVPRSSEHTSCRRSYTVLRPSVHPLESLCKKFFNSLHFAKVVTLPHVSTD